MSVHITIRTGDVLKGLRKAESLSLDPVLSKTTIAILNRARAPGGTPVKTGQLRISSGVTGHTMGYAKEYAPHVEYGHRHADGHYQKPQYYLKRNVETQRPIFKKDVLQFIQAQLDK